MYECISLFIEEKACERVCVKMQRLKIDNLIKKTKSKYL